MTTQTKSKIYICGICGGESTARDGHYDCTPTQFLSLKEIERFVARENMMAKSPMTSWSFRERPQDMCYEVQIKCSGDKIMFFTSDIEWTRKVKMFFMDCMIKNDNR